MCRVLRPPSVGALGTPTVCFVIRALRLGLRIRCGINFRIPSAAMGWVLQKCLLSDCMSFYSVTLQLASVCTACKSTENSGGGGRRIKCSKPASAIK